MRQGRIRSGIVDVVVSAVKFIYGMSLLTIGLIGSLFIAAVFVGAQIVPANAGLGAAAVQGLKALTIVTESTGLQSDLYASLLFGGFVGGASAVGIYFKSTEIIGRLL